MRATAIRGLVARHTLTSPSPLIRARGAASKLPASLEDDFAIYPDFFSPAESRELLALALWKLDRVDSKRRRRRRGATAEEEVKMKEGNGKGAVLQDLFVGPYGFEEVGRVTVIVSHCGGRGRDRGLCRRRGKADTKGHFDSVIHNYRESLITNLPSDATPDLSRILAKLYSLVPSLYVPSDPDATSLPPPNSSTHALHLAPEGAILPHVDNLDASGQTIVGASLGATRILRLEREGDKEQGWDVLLPSGSVYVQRCVVGEEEAWGEEGLGGSEGGEEGRAVKGQGADNRGSVRYEYSHSILAFGKESNWQGVPLPPGHRVSFMVRVSLSVVAFVADGQDAPTRQAQL